ncbi:hypothetical protein C3E97_028085 [Pseudomonas sp. MWU12-2115]|uniref:hypothetical protein n=1 Tax=unclassified Pseudomonas TaxID=196821 RepID=UPI000CD548C2|nr:hypothetical protein [Pseudomonas sp. MWU12-2020]RBB97323.1 hypothetical protein C3E97_028085 [Pseudomonas sp. MWU12-2115]
MRDHQLQARSLGFGVIAGEQEAPNRELFEAFNADRDLTSVRRLRQELTDPMSELRLRVKSFREGLREMTTSSAQELRESVLRMLQLQHAMIEACESIPAQYSEVKSRILADFDTELPVAYLKTVNGWLRMIEGFDAG